MTFTMALGADMSTFSTPARQVDVDSYESMLRPLIRRINMVVDDPFVLRACYSLLHPHR